MRILLLAPQPYYADRGTPIAVDLLVRALGERGDTVDLLTFHLGEDRSHPGLTLHRIRPWPAPRSVPPGLSLAKLWCDLFLFCSAFALARRKRPDVIHAVEETSFIAMFIGRILSIPYVVDMDSSMAGQIVAKYRVPGWLARALHWMESRPIRHAAAVVPMCEELADVARKHCNGTVTVLHDVSLLGESRPEDEREDLRASLGIEGPMAMYIGNLESYQGIDLMLEAFQVTSAGAPAARLVVIGGSQQDIALYKEAAAVLGLTHCTHFVGPRPVRQLAHFMSQADVLISPRISGDNTPMKIYSYLDSGVAVVATELKTHTQAVSSSEAVLVTPEPGEMGNAILRLLHSPEERGNLASRARELVRAKYSWEAFKATVNVIYGQFDSAQLVGTPVEPSGHGESSPT